MKQKYIISKEKDLLVVKEYAELDKDLMSLLCEETYSQEDLKEAMAIGMESLIQVIRTHNLYPPSIYVTRLADIIITLMNDEELETQELRFDDKEMFLKDIKLEPEVKEPEVKEAEVKEAEETSTGTETPSADKAVDDLLEDSEEDEAEEKKIITDLKSSIKVADDDAKDDSSGGSDAA